MQNGHGGHLFEASVGEDLTEDGAGLTAGTSGQLVSDRLDLLPHPPSVVQFGDSLNSKTVFSQGDRKKNSSLGRQQLSQALTQIREKLCISSTTKGN